MSKDCSDEKMIEMEGRHTHDNDVSCVHIESGKMDEGLAHMIRDGEPMEPDDMPGALRMGQVECLSSLSPDEDEMVKLGLAQIRNEGEQLPGGDGTYEEDEIEKILGFPAPVAAGWHMYVKIHVRDEYMHPVKDEGGNSILGPDGNPLFIALPESMYELDKYKQLTGLVVSQGIDAYHGKRFEHSGPWCQVGDWIVFDRNEGTPLNYRGVSMQIIPDDACKGVVEDPNYVSVY